MNYLEHWLSQATRHLSLDSIAQVRTEIQDHFGSAREAAMAVGKSADEADGLALAELGDARAANRQYRKVLLTSAEARALREGNREASAICSQSRLRRTLLIASLGALMASLASYLLHSVGYTEVFLVAGTAAGFLFALPLLPVYTPLRSRVFRVTKWIVFAGVAALVFGPHLLQWSWLLLSCLWPLAWSEWQRISIRRKLPVSKWPRQLYL